MCPRSSVLFIFKGVFMLEFLDSITPGVIKSAWAALSKIPSNYAGNSQQYDTLFELVMLVAVLAVFVVGGKKLFSFVKYHRAEARLWADIERLRSRGHHYNDIPRLLADSKTISKQLAYLAEKRGREESITSRQAAVISLLKRKGVFQKKQKSQNDNSFELRSVA